jgi:hypothetical protein
MVKHFDIGEPIIYHGFTLTSRIKFSEVIKVVKRDAFVTSDYPVVLSLEVHCGLKQQDRMAEILKEILGDILVTKKIQGVCSPENLKNRIILKGKAVPDSGSIESLDSIASGI